MRKMAPIFVLVGVWCLPLAAGAQFACGDLTTATFSCSSSNNVTLTGRLLPAHGGTGALALGPEFNVTGATFHFQVPFVPGPSTASPGMSAKIDNLYELNTMNVSTYVGSQFGNAAALQSF